MDIKKTISSTLLIFLSFIAVAQNNTKYEARTILGDDLEYGGYGSFTLGYTKISNYNTFTGGMKGAWLINHKLGLGLAGNGFATKTSEIKNKSFLTGGYGGFLVEPIFFSNNPIHFTVPLLIGGGGIAYVSERIFEDYFAEIYDVFFVFEPGIEMEINMTSFLRIALGISYKITSDIDMTTSILGKEISILQKDDLNKFTVSLVFKFGKF